MSRAKGSHLRQSGSEVDLTDTTLAIVFGDQLDRSAKMLTTLDRASDTVLMMEVGEESTHVPSHIQRTVLFLSAMRHFAAELVAAGYRVRYVTLDDPSNTQRFESEIERAALAIKPKYISFTHPGEWRVLNTLRRVSEQLDITLNSFPDEHFLVSQEEFAEWANGRRTLTMEYFYRQQRRRTGYLMDAPGPKGQPEGGVWNFDKSNRLPFGKDGPKPRPPRPIRFTPDEVTRTVITMVRGRFPDMYGELANDADFGWPVTRNQALEVLSDFIRHRLPLFGPYEDAMWTDVPHVYHSLLSPALNLKLLSPRECCEAALAAYDARAAPLQSVEAFIRQLIGWREFIRGIYWLEGPDYAERNGLDQHGRLPEFYWTARTDMNCMHQCLSQVLETGHGHHIQRLMVTGNFALISGVHPRLISDWYLAMYVDGVDWVTLPNALGMVMHADARRDSSKGVTGLVGTKPYAASGKYIQRMSNYCLTCRYDPTIRTGDNACPMNIFYWDFLIRTREHLRDNHRMALIAKGVDTMARSERTQITVDAALLRSRFGITHDAASPHSQDQSPSINAPPASGTGFLFTDHSRTAASTPPLQCSTPTNPTRKRRPPMRRNTKG